MNSSPSTAQRPATCCVRWKTFSIALLGCLALVFLASCKKEGSAAKPANVDYYTCTMHPSVKKQSPKDKCPICSMDLVPVKKRAGDTANRGDGESPAHRHTDSPVQSGTREESLSEFTVPVQRLQQIGVTYAT